MSKNKLLFTFLGLLPFLGIGQTITVDDTQTLDQLIDGVLISGDCADVANITSPNNSSVAGEGYESYASFDATNANFPFTDGIVLANKEVTGIPDGTGDSGSNPPWDGDPDLEPLIQEPGNTNNATVIEFDFIPFVDEISFDYLLASNEWPNFVCSFADTFAFILSGPGISNVNSYNHDANPNTPDVQLDLGGLNIATIPGTNIPVSPVNIHLNDNCGAGTLGEFAVPQLFDQTFSDNGSTEFTGQTEPLAVNADVIPGETYQIKLVIADRGDSILDSAVFIEGSSFDIGEVDLGPDITLGSDEAVCEGDTITLDAGPGGTNTTYTWFQDFQEIPGANGQFLDVTESGTYSVAVAFSLDCLQTDSITIEFFPEPEVPTGETAELCAGGTVTLDGTPTNLSDIVNPQYQWFKDGTAISGATNPTIDVDEAGVYEIEVDAAACTNITGDFTVDVLDYQVDIVQPAQNCVDTGQTLEVSADVTGLSSAQESNLDYEWTFNGNTEITETIQLGSTQSVTLTTTVNGCERTSTETIEVYTNPEVSSSLGEATLCQGETNTLDATPDNASNLADISYTWFQDGTVLSGETNAVLQIDEGGNYEVEVDNNGCVATLSIDVNVIDYQVDIVQPAQNCVDTGQTLEVSADVTGLSSAQEDDLDYEWTFNGNTAFTETIQLGSTQNVTLTTTINGCERTSTETIEVFTNPEVPSLGNSIICPGDTSNLNATPDNASALADTSYTWFQDGAELVGETNAVLQIDESGNYEVEVDNNGCTTTQSIDVDLVDYNLDLGTDVTACTDAGGSNSFEIVPQITGIPDSDLDQVDYDWGNGETSGSIVVDANGTYSLTTTYQGCTQTDEVQVTFIQALAVDLGNDFQSCFTDQVTLTTGLPNDDPDISFIWTKDGSVLNNETSSSLAIEEEGTYEVEVNNQGCISSAMVDVTGYDVDNCTITQGISPNEDGANDCLDLAFLNDRSGIDNVQIFNRYGRKVFESNNYVDQFCGQDDDGDKLTTGTYFYVIKLAEEDEQFGNVAKGYIYISEEQ